MKKKFDFNFLNDTATDIASFVNCGTEERKALKESILKLAAYSCTQYITDKEFRTDIDKFIERTK